MFQWLVKAVKSSSCALCYRSYHIGGALCPDCRADLPRIELACRICATPLAQRENLDLSNSSLICGQCLQNPANIYLTLAPYQYQQPIQGLIYALKFSRQHYYADILADLLCHRLEEYYASGTDIMPQYLIPVPLHPKRLRQRGYNQALEIAKPIAKKFNIPILWKRIVRLRHTDAQAEIDRQQRAQNVKNAFAVKTDLSNCHVAIIDDVYTSGNTVKSLAQALDTAGVSRVDVWCCARAVWD